MVFDDIDTKRYVIGAEWTQSVGNDWVLFLEVTSQAKATFQLVHHMVSRRWTHGTLLVR